MTKERTHAGEAALLAAAVFAVHAAGACRTIYVGDSGELVAAAATVGIPHPSGYPLYVLLGKLWTLLLPVGMPDGEREGFRIGAVAAVVAKMKASDGAWLADSTRHLRNTMMREKVAAIMPDDATRAAWSNKLNFEVTSSQVTGQSLKNSATARRMAQREDAECLAGDLILEAFAGAPPVTLLRKMAGVIPTKVRDTMRSRSDNVLADLLLTHINDPQGMKALTDAMNRVTQKAAPPSVLRTNAAIMGTEAGLIE